MATDLESNRGKSLVIVGRRQPPAVHALVHALNSALGNVGHTVSWNAPLPPTRPSGASALAALREEIAGGRSTRW